MGGGEDAEDEATESGGEDDDDDPGADKSGVSTSSGSSVFIWSPLELGRE